MSIVLNLPMELENKLAKEASRHGVPLSEYLLRVLSNGGESKSNVGSGAELVAYWQRANLIGTRPEIGDSQEHARRLRQDAEQRP